MASIFKTLTTNDVASTRTLLNEAIPITGTIVSGTWAPAYNDDNIKNYGHGMFQSIYDFPTLSSSANHIIDITAGYSTGSAFNLAASTQNTKKINIYNQMAQVLLGYHASGTIKSFRRGSFFDGTESEYMHQVFFMNFSRLLVKDEIKKGSTVLKMYTAGTEAIPTVLSTISDYQATGSYYTNSPAGEYGQLYTSSAEIFSDSAVGLIFYQAGVVVLTASLFTNEFGGTEKTYDTSSVDNILKDQSISASCDGLRNRVDDIDFNNTTELNSTIYFCRANHNDFNYSANPTYTSGSKLNVKNSTTDSPVSYITSVGLYSADNELLAVAKLSEPLKKDPSTEVTLRVRTDW